MQYKGYQIDVFPVTDDGCDGYGYQISYLSTDTLIFNSIARMVLRTVDEAKVAAIAYIDAVELENES